MKQLPRDRLDDPARLRELHRLQVLDSVDEQFFDEMTRMAAEMCETPIALISLVDETRQWFKARTGLAAQETPREMAFCAHLVDAGDTLVVQDATKDARFVANPLVTGDPNIRFYAGAPLVTSNGQTIGSLCVIDSVPRRLSNDQLEQLQFMAEQVMSMLEQRAKRQDVPRF